MNEEKILNAIGLVGDDLITRADGPIPAAGFGKSWLRWGTLAACLCAVVGLSVLLRPMLGGLFGAKSAAPAAAEAPAAMMMDEAATTETAVAEEESAAAPAEEAPAEPESERQAVETPKSEAAAEGGVIREPITVMGRYYEQILSSDPDYTPAELTEEDLEFYIERSNGDRVYVLTWTETPAGVESWPYTIAVFRDGRVPLQFRYIGDQHHYDNLPGSMRIGTANFKRVGVDDPLTFFHEDFPEESLGKPWQVLADGSRLYAVSEPILTPNELTEGLSNADLVTADRIMDSLRLQADEMSDGGLATVDSALVLLFADDDRAAAYLIMASPIVCFGQRYTEVTAEEGNTVLSEIQQNGGEGIQSPWNDPWCTLSDGSRVTALYLGTTVEGKPVFSEAVVGDMVFPEYVIRNFDYGPSVIYRFSGS